MQPNQIFSLEEEKIIADLVQLPLESLERLKDFCEDKK
jgi:hypothetical protein